MTELEQLRKIIADESKNAIDSELGDGDTVMFKLSHNKIKTGSYTVEVDDDLQVETTDFTIDLDEGLVIFTTAPADQSNITIKYQYSAFREEELEDFLELEGSLNNAAIRCIKTLLMDSARRFDYSAGQTDIKASQVFANLEKLLKIFQESGVGGNVGQTVAFKDRDNRYYKKTSDEETDLSRADL